MMEFSQRLSNKEDRMFAYFSMEVGFHEKIQTYSGGLGILAGDTIKSFADKRVPVVCVTLLNNKGYFKQHLDEYGNQTESDYEWDVEKYVQKVDTIIEVEIEGRTVKIGAWEYRMTGISGYEIPIYLLTTDIEGNSDYDKKLTQHLYGGDHYYRLCQEIVLGIGGTRFLEARGYHYLKRYHMNEGHASFLTIELLHKHSFDHEIVKKMCVFTTHTPVAAGHDKFSREEIKKTLGDYVPDEFIVNNELSTTKLALKLSHYVNGVAKKHKEVSEEMFPQFHIDYITNGVHSLTWTHDAFKRLFDEYIPGWRRDPYALRYATQIPITKIWEAHMSAKEELVQYINEVENTNFDADTFTIGFARRATGYKRVDLLFSDVERLKDIANRVGKIQLVFAGKSHKRDNQGKDMIRRIFSLKHEMKDSIKIVFLENYNMELAKKIIPGVDVWLNTPKRPLEASGTSGMKACHNGVPSFSILDGWWIEGHIEGITGWAIGGLDTNTDDGSDANDLYYKLDKMILPMFYNNQDQWVTIMKNSIAFNASFFNTNRMVSQYIMNAYLS